MSPALPLKKRAPEFADKEEVFAGASTAGDKPVLEVKDLSVSFVQYAGGLRQTNLKVISGLDVSIKKGEVLAVVGSSGSGKSLLAHAILGILPKNAKVSGTMHYGGEALTPRRQAKLRGREIAIIPQSVNYLDPLMRVGPQVGISVHNGDKNAIVRQVFARYGLEKKVEDLYPFQLSGGMARRVLVSTAVVSGARLVIADEPTPGLHPAVVAEALGHLRQLADEGCAVMLITHDITSALQMADRIAVFYAGSTVETAPSVDFYGKGQALRHPYSKALWQALPQNDFKPIAGFQPTPGNLPSGCLFAPRCEHKTPECEAERPPARLLRGGNVRCIHAT
ncbi:ABC transporter ATP-binding protein [Dethiobacter alkaliphilus]|uniref:Nickel import system ATP-binding protein NikD n=1 Tax=Dethiobacter alkaliphilus AHT 1 TaxID=555088 RepID=C0GFS8_DETAL|nr:ABC transporter ATP-binding protein [Dethiobacter alkaliphilus]EEG77617.1 oligopeptide/dipeptide ABC transporter, ATPase subunit [Dethiobacter alkaliphilus AHT 1]